MVNPSNTRSYGTWAKRQIYTHTYTKAQRKRKTPMPTYMVGVSYDRAANTLQHTATHCNTHTSLGITRHCNHGFKTQRERQRERDIERETGREGETKHLAFLGRVDKVDLSAGLEYAKPLLDNFGANCLLHNCVCGACVCRIYSIRSYDLNTIVWIRIYSVYIRICAVYVGFERATAGGEAECTRMH